MEIVWKGMLPKGKMMEEFMQQQNYERKSTRERITRKDRLKAENR